MIKHPVIFLRNSEDRYFNIIVLALIVFFIVVSINCLIQAIRWIDKPFPGFLIYKNSVICEVSLSSWTAVESGLIHSYEKVLGIDGKRMPSEEIYNYVFNKPVGTSARYDTARNGEYYSVYIPTMKFGIGDFLSVFAGVFVVGLVIFITGVTVYLLKPALISAKIFFLLCLALGVWFTTIFDAQSTYTLKSIPFLAWMFSPAFLVCLSSVFPSRIKYSNNMIILLLPFFPSLLLFFFHLVFLIHRLYG